MSALVRTLLLFSAFSGAPLNGVLGGDFERPSPELMRQYQRAAENTIAAVTKRIEPILTERQRAEFRKLKITVLPDSWNIYGIVNDGQNGIQIPLGLIFIQDHIDSAVVATEVGQLGEEVLVRYVSALTDAVQENQRAGNRRAPWQGLPAFPPFAGLPPDKWRSIVREEAYEPMKDLIKLCSFAFVLSHEFGHRFDKSVSTIDNERAADQLAADIAVKADFNPMFAYYSLALFAGLEEREKRTEQTHDPSLCRALLVFQRGILEAVKDKGFVDELKARHLVERWNAAPRRLLAALEESDITCPGFDESSMDAAKIATGKQKTGSSGSAKSYPMRATIWHPTPGRCDGVEFDLYIDGDLAVSFNNTLDTSPEELGELAEGEHQFQFRSITGYCIDPYPPFAMDEFASDGECSGSFKVKRKDDLRVMIRANPRGDITFCSLK